MSIESAVLKTYPDISEQRRSQLAEIRASLDLYDGACMAHFLLLFTTDPKWAATVRSDAHEYAALSEIGANPQEFAWTDSALLAGLSDAVRRKAVDGEGEKPAYPIIADLTGIGYDETNLSCWQNAYTALNQTRDAIRTTLQGTLFILLPSAAMPDIRTANDFWSMSQKIYDEPASQ